MIFDKTNEFGRQRKSKEGRHKSESISLFYAQKTIADLHFVLLMIPTVNSKIRLAATGKLQTLRFELSRTLARAKWKTNNNEKAKAAIA